MIIYKATNKINGKVYIGQTTLSLDKRKKAHLANAKKGVRTHFYDAIRKYGADNFVFEEICTANDKKILNELERYFIKEYDSIKTGYNMIDGGSNNVMDLPSVKEKHLKKLRDPKTREKISITMKEYRKNNPFTEEHRKKLSEKAMGNHNFTNPDTRSIGCYCRTISGELLHFHSYRDAWKWWQTVENPFCCTAECIFQRKIKQSIDNGFYTYKSVRYDYPKWFKEGVMPIEVTNS